ncbi:MAG: two-component system activity regulator YycH [Lutispora sp.]|nr:two-component system activity regulator YycH [Lutispora sp.]MDD4834553.1 two-component system activity regulator YycH [Lutispora sp.]
MVNLKLEKFKSATLFCLVLISIILTTQIWLNISIEGIFIMFKNKEEKTSELLVFESSNADLIKPEKLILNNNGEHTLLLNETEIGLIYDRILEDTKNMLSVILESKEGIESEKHPMDYMEKLRAGRTVELEFPYAYDYKLFAGLLGVTKAQWEEIKTIDTVLVGYESNAIYIVDKTGGSIYEFRSKTLKSSIKVMVDMINRGNIYSYIFLNEVEPERYSPKVIIPINISSNTMAKLSSSPEMVENNAENIAADFFDGDISTKRSFVDPAGTVVYTDGEAGIRISKAGVIEFVTYSAQFKDQKDKFDLLEAVNMATSFVNNHLGFPKDSYISSIEQITKNNRLYSCIVRYDYRYEGVSIINDETDMDNPIEVEIANGEIKRYKRIVKNIKKTSEERSIKNPLEIVDILLERLNHDKKIDINNILIKDIYMSYFEYGLSSDTYMIPVWVIEVEGNLGATGKYVLNAESGVILSEPY